MNKSFTKSGFLYYELTSVHNKPGIIINSDKQVYSETFGNNNLREEYLDILTNKLDELGITLFNIPLTAIYVNLHNLLSVEIVNNSIVLEFHWNNKILTYTSKEDLTHAYDEILAALALLSISGSGGSGGTLDYNKLINKPKVNGIELKGNKTLDDLGVPSIDSVNTLESNIQEIRIELTQLHNDFDAIDQGEIGDKAENDEVVHSKGVAYEQVAGDKDFLDKVQFMQEIPLDDISKRGATTEFVSSFVADKLSKINIEGGSAIDTAIIEAKIAQHNLDDQSHNDIRNTLKDLDDTIKGKADVGDVAGIDTRLELAEEDIDVLQGDMATFINVSKKAALKDSQNTFTERNTFKKNVVIDVEDPNTSDESGIILASNNSIVSGTNNKVILQDQKDESTGAQSTYLGGDALEIYAPDGVSVQTTGTFKIKRGNYTDGWNDYTNIDSGNINEYLSQTQIPDDVYTKTEVDEKVSSKSSIIIRKW